ncbi:nuclear transport factor 2 family protein [Chitinophaga nivalis]|uniref:Nuclear transport factor 2 family protein n=1 Tax=Chitinophaga nivalis TaxID=2991709 RepID=A0ABT3IWC8_9BACT|nr:nuclear transport factor 2 family protein [Chitinophaga nivalis]MCW3462024.1 nuclear transport factor 2 family protein [Chitinophaga nivalis]MCW3488284.1 nuclear transport factor 2 family protein [Chitinophaga nivalis]
MENQTAAVVNAFLTAVKAVNMEQLGALLHPDIIWEQPGHNRFAGTKKSIGEVFQMVGGMFAVSGNTMALTHTSTISVNGDQAAVVLHWTATRPGAVLDTDNVDVYTVNDGKIVAAKIYVSDPAQEDLFWGQQ